MKSVKIILNEDVYNLGEEGDVREVAPGYARNYLIPKGLAVAYSRQHVAQFEDRRAAIERRKGDKRDAALGLKERIEAMSLVFKAPAGDSGKLFGSVTNAAIADRLLQEGFQIERKKIDVPGHTIKMLGTFDVTVKLYANESANLKVVIEAVEGAVAPKPAERPKAVEATREESELNEEESEESDDDSDEDESYDDSDESAEE